MARITVTILLISLSYFSVSAKIFVFIINQYDTAFVIDANKWQSYFNEKYKGVDIKRLSDYKIEEVNKQIKNYYELLNKNDTLILIITAHMIPNYYGEFGYRGAIILKLTDILPDLENDVIWQYQLLNWLDYFEKNSVRVLLILNTCEPYLIADSIQFRRYNYLTTFYSTNKEYCILSRSNGSLLINTLMKKNLNTLYEYCNYLSNDWLKKEYYMFIDGGIDAMKFYPIKPMVIGNDFKF
jgi:hypothetical protein